MKEKLFLVTFSMYNLLLLCFLISSSCAVQPATEPPTGDPLCALVHCGQGTCIASGTGFDCECYPGWKKLQIGFLTFPACVIPNCTIDLQCGTTVPPPPSSWPPPPPPPADLLDPCTYTWCGDGNCVATGLISTVCQCNEGSTNLFNNTSFPCFNPCSFGIDCVGLGIEVTGQPSPPPRSHSGSKPKQVPSPNCSSRLQALTVAVIATILLM